MRYFLSGVLIGLVLLFLCITFSQAFKTGQPISFNHKKHLEQGLECDTCHLFYKTQSFSGLPKITICLECHKDPITQNPEEEKIRQLEREKKEITWRQVYEQPDHVFYSHRRHVVLGKLECSVCHGDMKESETPPSKPWVKMNMSWCMECHIRSKVTNDCAACHV